jgi:ubiquinol-cytochrome c reductase cytochrome b subunit
MARVFIWGAYKKPRELTWLLGSCLMLLVLSLMFMGALLPWDELGYWAAEVGTSMAGTVPLVGDFLRRLWRGGPTTGQLTLSRFFFLHVAVLPLLAAFFILLHVIALRQFRNVGPWDPEKQRRTGPFWPDQVLKDMVFASVIFLILVGLCAFWPAPITGPADPVDNTYQPKPEWCFLFLYQALKAFKGRWEPVGTLLLPALLILVVFLLPFYDRGKERDPCKRPLGMALACLLGAFIIVLTIWGYYSNPGGTLTNSPALRQTGAALPAAVSLPGVQEGEKLFHDQGCTACHAVSGQGGAIGPDLSSEGSAGRSRDWLTAQIHAPKSHKPDSIMPAFAQLSDQQVSALVDYLMRLTARGSAAAVPPTPGATAPSFVTTPALGGAQLPAAGRQGPPGPAADIVANPEHGALLFADYCQACHGPEGADQVPNPGSAAGKVPALRDMSGALFDEDPDVFAENIDRFIQHGSVPAGPHPVLQMPNFGDSHSLTQQQISQIEAYVLSLNGVDRALIRKPGLAPPVFFGLVAGVLAMAWIAAGTWWLSIRRSRAVQADAPPSSRVRTMGSPAGLAMAAVLIIVAVGAALSLIFSPFLKVEGIPTIETKAPTPESARPTEGPGGMLMFNPPALDTAPADVRAAVKRGHDLLMDTGKMLPQNVGNKLTCSNCHFLAGMARDSVCLVGVSAEYPRVNPRTGREATLARKTNACLEMNLNGKPIPDEGPDMLDILAYYRWISSGIPVGADVPWLGLQPLQSSYQPTAAKGKAIYEGKCAVCHGNAGQGGTGPPVWGDGSYTDGSQMAESKVLAAFVKRFMPQGNPNLTDEEALDVSAYMTPQPRPHRSPAGTEGTQGAR